MPETHLFRTSDDYHHHFRHWPAAGDLRGFVVALHGIQSHSGWYEYSSARLAEAGYDVRFLDRRGSGLNGCQRGHTPHYERLVNDVRQFLRKLRHERDRTAPGTPIYLLSVSWGGKTAAAAAALSPDLIDGLALLYPGICAKIRPSWRQSRLLKLATAYGKGARRIPVPLDDPALFTGEEKYQEFIRNDRLALHQVSLDFLRGSLDIERLIAERIGDIRAPLLCMTAGQDEIVDNHATERLLIQAGSHSKTFYDYPEARHTLEFEPNREAIFGDLIHWLNHLPASGVSG